MRNNNILSTIVYEDLAAIVKPLSSKRVTITVRNIRKADPMRRQSNILIASHILEGTGHIGGNTLCHQP